MAKHPLFCAYANGKTWPPEEVLRTTLTASIHLSDISEEGIAFKQQKTGARLIVGMSPYLAARAYQGAASNGPRDNAFLFTSRRKASSLQLGEGSI
ncbi:hypothetical protein D3C80_1516290 [compost metagenome]